MYIFGIVGYMSVASTTHTTRKNLIEKATINVCDILNIAIQHTELHKALVVYDTENELTNIMVQAYRNALPDAEFIDFNTRTKEEIIAKFNALSPRDLVVLIQTRDFRLNEFRIRIHLFQRKLKVIDHLHLYRNTPDSWETYINALAYDASWYRGVGRRLKTILEKAKELQLESRGNTLTITGGLEIPKLNIGDYQNMENIGGTFPIGEVFTEARQLERVQGSLMIYAFAGTDFNITMHPPFRIDIVDGILTGWSTDAPNSFIEIVRLIRAHERPLLREIGFGLNRAITRERYLKDITAFERTYGMHVSLGEKHSVYKKAGITADKTRFHVDLFPVIDRVVSDNQTIFENGKYLV